MHPTEFESLVKISGSLEGIAKLLKIQNEILCCLNMSKIPRSLAMRVNPELVQRTEEKSTDKKKEKHGKQVPSKL